MHGSKMIQYQLNRYPQNDISAQGLYIKLYNICDYNR